MVLPAYLRCGTPMRTRHLAPCLAAWAVLMFGAVMAADMAVISLYHRTHDRPDQSRFNRLDAR